VDVARSSGREDLPRPNYPALLPNGGNLQAGFLLGEIIGASPQPIGGEGSAAQPAGREGIKLSRSGKERLELSCFGRQRLQVSWK
jgi:hypothetical protein